VLARSPTLLSRNAGRAEKHYAGLAPYTTYTARTIFLQSPAFNYQLRGLSAERLREYFDWLIVPGGADQPNAQRR
jgi:hypothetical protein